MSSRASQVRDAQPRPRRSQPKRTRSRSHRAPARSARPRQRATTPAQARAELKVVRGKKRGLIQRRASRRVAPVFVIGAILIAATIFTVLLEQVVLAQAGFKMDKMRDEIVQAETENAQLVLKVAKMSASERIERVAIRRLGMVKPKDVHYIVANIRTGRDPLLADHEVPEIMPGTGVAAGDYEAGSP